MTVIGVFAALPVRDLAASEAFYTTLLGRAPDHRPIPGMVQWVSGAGGVQLFAEPERAGQGRATLVVSKLSEVRAVLAAADIVLGAESRGEFGAVAPLEDPDGNRITLAEPPG